MAYGPYICGRNSITARGENCAYITMLNGFWSRLYTTGQHNVLAYNC